MASPGWRAGRAGLSPRSPGDPSVQARSPTGTFPPLPLFQQPHPGTCPSLPVRPGFRPPFLPERPAFGLLGARALGGDSGHLVCHALRDPGQSPTLGVRLDSGQPADLFLAGSPPPSPAERCVRAGPGRLGLPAVLVGWVGPRRPRLLAACPGPPRLAAQRSELGVPGQTRDGAGPDPCLATSCLSAPSLPGSCTGEFLAHNQG